jgi:hypothetical protein
LKRLVAAAAVIIGLSVTMVLGTPAPSGATGAPNSPTGYRLVASDGEVFGFGGATDHGSAGGSALRAPIVGMGVTPTGRGYWLVGGDGGVFSFGDAPFYGSTGSITLDQPIVGVTAAPDGKGYWLVGADGGAFSYGDATFAGSTASQPIHAPIVGMSSNRQLLGGAPGGGSPEFSITFKNNTQRVSTFVIYQPDPSGVPGGQPLAWLTVALWPGNQHTLTWSTDYSLTWGTTGVLSPGLIYQAGEQAGEQWALTTDSPTNSVQLDYHGSFGLDFGPPEPPGSFWVTESFNIPKDVASVGLGMNGEPVVAIQANPGQVAQITPHPAYWVTAGQIPRSQVLDVDHLTNSAPVSFPSGVTAMQATLSTGDVWSVIPVPS